MTGTKARTAIAACALALAAGSAEIATASASAADAPAHAAKAHRCPAISVSAQAGVVRRISIRCNLGKPKRAHRVNRAPARIADRPDDGRIIGVNRHRNVVRYRARPGFAGRDSFVVVRRNRGVPWRLVVKVNVPAAEAQAAPICQSEPKTTNYETSVELVVVCRGSGIAPLIIAGGPSNGTIGNVKTSGNSTTQALSATYLPNKLFVGNDELRVEARSPGGRSEIGAKVAVRQWRMRAFGDSATAGFGFFSNGEEFELLRFPECEPPTPINDRCSSNSDGGYKYEGPINWSADFGLGNDISWAAQFANDWQGGGHITAPVMFQNRAVTGSTPAEWLPGGPLNSVLTTILREDPDLIAFTLGVNPLLGKILEEFEGRACIVKSTTVEAVEKCIEPIFNSVAVRERLESIYKGLLGAPDAEVVTFQYHLAFPELAAIEGFQPWQIEALINYLNAQIAAAVGSVKAALPLQANRLTLIEAQVDPNQPNPQKVPRFNLGGPPNPAQSWTAKYECGGGFKVDGPSHQSSLSQEIPPGLFGSKFCPGEPWTIKADTGIHPNKAGYTQFATALTNVAIARGLVPPLP